MAKRDTKLQQLAKLVKEELNGNSYEDASEIFLSLLKEGFISVTDVRQQVKVKHYMHDCIGIVLFCAFSDIDEWIEMEMFARDNEAVLKKYLDLPNGIPSHDTLERVMSIIKPAELENIMVDVLRDTIRRASQKGEYFYVNEELDLVIKDVVAIDGKETRNSGNPHKDNIEERRNFNVLNVQSTETGITLSTTRIDEKTNEIPEAQAVLKVLDLRGCIVTADAMNTQKETVESIVGDAHADYCLAVKANQRLLYDDLVLYFHDEELLKKIKEHDGWYLRETEERTYSVITMEHYITEDVSWYSQLNQWKKLKSFGYVKKTVVNKETGEATTEERYYICSFRAAADLFALVIRRHWHVENLLHWLLDVVFREDSLHTREKKALQNLGLVHRFVLSVLKILKPYYNMSFRYMRRKIGRNFEKEIPVVFAALKAMYDMGYAE